MSTVRLNALQAHAVCDFIGEHVERHRDSSDVVDIATAAGDVGSIVVGNRQHTWVIDFAGIPLSKDTASA